MEQITVETTGSFMLIDRTHGHQEIGPNGPFTVPNTPFVQLKLRAGQLRKLEDAAPADETAPKAKRGK